jgi:hypothetical protein
MTQVDPNAALHRATLLQSQHPDLISPTAIPHLAEAFGRQMGADPYERAAKVAEHVGRVFGEQPPYGERGTNIVWDTARLIASRIRALKSGDGE